MHPQYWASPETTSVNRLPMLSIEHVEKLSLDGTWIFQLLHTPNESLRKRWAKVEIPSLWTMEEDKDLYFDKALTTNGGLPITGLSPHSNSDNPTGVYERDFEIPGSWENKRIVLQLGGFESVVRVVINGFEIGLSKDSRLAAEFDITKSLKGGKNTIRLYVSKWSDASFIEDLDHSWHGGISQSIKLYATHEVFIERLYTTTGISRDLKTGSLEIQAFIGSINGKSREGFTLRATIEELPKVKSASMAATLDGDTASTSGEIFFAAKIGKILPWSAEDPQLYTLHVELIDPLGIIVQISSQKIGFRSVQVKGFEVIVNNKAVRLTGVDRRDLGSAINRIANRDQLRQILFELKRRNFTALHTSHFSSTPTFLDLCDELGFYVIAEPNIQLVPIAEFIADDPTYLSAFVDRASRMVQRDIHHPAVIAWSLGDQSDSGINFETAAAYIQAMDSSRPLIGFEDEEFDADFVDVEPIISVTTKSPASGRFEVMNNQEFLPTSDYEIEWSITRDEIEIARGVSSIPLIAPQKSNVVVVKSSALTKIDGKGKRAITIVVRNRKRTAWTSANAEVFRGTFALPARTAKR
jgi:beta-galactosidase